MSDLFVAKKNYSIEEYQLLEERSIEKLEYYDGKIIPMPGGTINHNTIVMNLLSAFDRLAEERHDLRVFTSDQKIYLPRYNFIVYPDAVVICGKPETTDQHKDALINPILIVEVLSRSTEAYDRGHKFDLYQSLPSLLEYVLVRQERPELLSYFRAADNTWQVTEAVGADNALLLRSLGISLPLAKVYRHIEFNTESEGFNQETP